LSKHKGYIALFRDIKDHWIWDDKPFNKPCAWIDLIMSANHNGNKVLIGNELIDVKRGELITSQEKLQTRWGWSNTKVRDFLLLLEQDNMIVKKTDNKKTAIEIVNYDDYQIKETAKKPQKLNEKTDEKPQKHTNNKEEECLKNEEEDLTIAQNPEIEIPIKGNLNQKKEWFDFFWSMYPKKVGKAKAESVWSKLQLDESLFNRIISGLENSIKFDNRFRDQQFIPHPATWLNGKEWENSYETMSNATKVLMNMEDINDNN
jgi:hypothetical protein